MPDLLSGAMLMALRGNVARTARQYAQPPCRPLGDHSQDNNARKPQQRIVQAKFLKRNFGLLPACLADAAKSGNFQIFAFGIQYAP
jgi:hypothetical protein